MNIKSNWDNFDEGFYVGEQSGFMKCLMAIKAEMDNIDDEVTKEMVKDIVYKIGRQLNKKVNV